MSNSVTVPCNALLAVARKGPIPRAVIPPGMLGGSCLQSWQLGLCCSFPLHALTLRIGVKSSRTPVESLPFRSRSFHMNQTLTGDSCFFGDMS